MNNLVSIIMPNYNSAPFLGEAIESVLKQTYKDWELIIVDDCSTDDSARIIENYVSKDKRIKFLKNDNNLGAALSRNKAIAIAQGRWISLLDSDDFWMPNKLEIQIAFMKERECFFSFAGVSFMDEKGEDLGISLIPSKGQYSYKDVLLKNDIGCVTTMYDAKRLGKIFMPVEAIKREDYAWFLEILKKTDGFAFKEIIAKYRIHKSVSSNKLKMVKYQWNVFKNVENIGFFKSLFYMMTWAFNGWRKYRK